MKVALCIMSKNEQGYLQENIKHHLLLGIDTIIIYDNNSSPPLKNIKWFKEHPHLHIVDWNDTKYYPMLELLIIVLNILSNLIGLALLIQMNLL